MQVVDPSMCSVPQLGTRWLPFTYVLNGLIFFEERQWFNPLA